MKFRTKKVVELSLKVFIMVITKTLVVIKSFIKSAVKRKRV